MAIPKTIMQTFKTSKLPLITRFHIWNMKRMNPNYDYQFYDDERIEAFLAEEYGAEMLSVYRCLNIGAAKADFFRYAYLYKKGGVYVDIDSLIARSLDKLISPNDKAIISLEGTKYFYVQWGLIYEAGHPFLKKTIDMVVNNINANKFPHDVHSMTGPAAYSLAIKACLKENAEVDYKEVDVDYAGYFKSHYRGSKFFIYGLSRKNHWHKQQQARPVLK